MKKVLIIVLLLMVATVVRLYQITNHTEFLGDQGRDALAIREFIKEGKAPVVGPTVGAGHYTGPFYYYLITPAFLLGESNPVAAAVEMVILSVGAIVLFLIIATSLFSFQVAYGVSVLWALSPLMIIQDRRLWNPTPIPFFVLLLVGSLVWIVKEKKYWGFLTSAFASAALLQLHYVNGISLFLAGLCFIGIIYMVLKQGREKIIIPWLLGSIGVFMLVVYPFIAYEMNHGFKDISGSLMTLSLQDGQVFSKRLYVNTFMDISSKLASYILALPWKVPLFLISVYLLVGNLMKKKIVSYILVIWLGLGVACLSFYKDTFQPQYAYQFIPIVFLLLCGLLSGIRKNATLVLVGGVVTIATLVSWSFIKPYKTIDPDIPRIEALIDTVLAQVGEDPFAFTIMNSRSFTDFHMRYFFNIKNADVVPIDDMTYQKLVILCEGSCPKVETIGKISVLCHTELCPMNMPEVSLKDWTYVSTTDVGSSTVYMYKR